MVKNYHVESILGELKEKLISDVWLSLLIVALLGILTTAYRAELVGVTNATVMYRGLIGFVILFFVFGDNCSTETKAKAASGALICTAIPAYLESGFYSGAGSWFMYFLILVAFYFPTKMKQAVVLVVCCSAYAAYTFTVMQQPLPYDANDYIYRIESWSSTLLGAMIFIFFIARSIKLYNQKLETLANDLSELKSLNEELANHDNLTGLANTRLANERLDMAIKTARREHTEVAVLYFDLDEFKAVNDNFGHDIGDALLIEVANRLNRRVRETDTLARVGGDEFVLIMPNIKDTRAVSKVSDDIYRLLNQSFEIEGHKIQIGVSIGAAIYPDDISVDGDNEIKKQLLKIADTNMYADKNAHKVAYIDAKKSLISATG